MSDVWTQEHFKRLWARLIDTYGSRFSSEYGSEPNETWKDAIKLLTYEQTAYAIREGVAMGDEHPPNLAKFCYRARQYEKVEPVLSAYNPLPKLPKPEITQEQIDKNRKKLKSMAAQWARDARMGK